MITHYLVLNKEVHAPVVLQDHHRQTQVPCIRYSILLHSYTSSAVQNFYSRKDVLLVQNVLIHVMSLRRVLRYMKAV